MISRIEKRVRQMGEREISSKVLGEIIMSELKTLDDVAYVRFASVYRDFQDIDAFHQEIANIRPNEKLTITLNSFYLSTFLLSVSLMTLSNHTQNAQDRYFMMLAIEQAKQGLYTTRPNPAVGCVIVQKQKRSSVKGFIRKLVSLMQKYLR